MREFAMAAGLVLLTATTVVAVLYYCPMTTRLLFGQPRTVFERPADMCVPFSPG